jgi:hypothetical protein
MSASSTLRAFSTVSVPRNNISSSISAANSKNADTW